MLFECKSSTTICVQENEAEKNNFETIYLDNAL